jgi:biotin carboxyl carrier protein
MLNIKVNQKTVFKVEDSGKDQMEINGRILNPDVYFRDKKHAHILIGNKSYNVELLELNEETGTLKIRVNSGEYEVEIKDRFDDLLRDLGMDKGIASKVNEIKAPMPGLVLHVNVNEGDEIKKGDSILVLEAMKMENNIKSPVDGRIKKIQVSKGLAVEKGQVLVSFA